MADGKEDEGAERQRAQPLRVTEVGGLQAARAMALPIASSSVQAGFPSPADDYVEKKLDLQELLIQHPIATFFVKVEGDSMVDAGIRSGDILIVDRSLTATSGKIIVAVLNGEFTVKRFVSDGQKVVLKAESACYPDIIVHKESDFLVWGVVTYVIHKAS